MLWGPRSHMKSGILLANSYLLENIMTFRDIWVDFHLDVHGDRGLFHEVLADASNGTHKYKFDIKCPGQRRNRNFRDMKKMFERHSNGKDFLQLRGGWQRAQAELGVSVRSRRSTDKLTFKGRNF
eukprot:762950_1